MNTHIVSNRAARRAATGRHRKAQAGSLVAAIAMAATAAGIVLAPAAHADPDQGGVTGGGQGGVTGGRQGGVTGGGESAAVPPAPADPIYYVEPPAQYDVPYQPIPNYNYDTYTYDYVAPTSPPVQIEDLHLPVWVEPTAPYIAPRDRVRVGDFESQQPNWMLDADRERLNNQSAVIEAQVTDLWRSIGVPTDRAQRLAASQIAAGLGGGLTGGLVAGVPAAVVGGGVGCGIGAAVGFTAGAAFIPASVAAAGAGCAIGAGIGAAAAGIPAAATGAVIGGGLGAATVTPFAAGDLGEPIDIGLQDIDQTAITTQVDVTLEQWSHDPVGAVVVDAVESVPVVAEQARDWVATQPGGDQLVQQFDATVHDFVTNTTPGLAGDLVAAAVNTGILPN